MWRPTRRWTATPIGSRRRCDPRRRALTQSASRTVDTALGVASGDQPSPADAVAARHAAAVGALPSCDPRPGSNANRRRHSLRRRPPHGAATCTPRTASLQLAPRYALRESETISPTSLAMPKRHGHVIGGRSDRVVVQHGRRRSVVPETTSPLSHLSHDLVPHCVAIADAQVRSHLDSLHIVRAHDAVQRPDRAKFWPRQQWRGVTHQLSRKEAERACDFRRTPDTGVHRQLPVDLLRVQRAQHRVCQQVAAVAVDVERKVERRLRDGQPRGRCRC